MRKIILILLIFSMFVFMGCGCSEPNKFTLETTITPKLTLLGDKIAVKYKLGDLLILDEWRNLNAGEMLFLTTTEEIPPVYLRLKCSDSFWDSNYFYYTIGNISTQTTPVKWSILYRNIDSFPNVMWTSRKDDNKKSNSTGNITTKKNPIKEKSEKGEKSELKSL